MQLVLICFDLILHDLEFYLKFSINITRYLIIFTSLPQ